MVEENIADSVRKCLDKFYVVRKAVSSEAAAFDQKAAFGVEEDEARFKIWTGNIGAHSTRRRSLQYRLRDASHLQKQIKSLLNELSELLEDAFLIISGAKVPWDRAEDDMTSPLEDDYDADSECDEIPTTEMAQIAQNVSDVINCLLRLSVAIRNPAPHDRFTTFLSIDASHYEPFDIQHVKTKFDRIEPFLADRLGQATSRRRQYFKYRENHHLKLKQGLDPAEQNDLESTIASSLPRHAKAAGFSLGAMDEDEASDSGLTQTSLASSKEGSEKLRIPPLPKEAEDGPFECPFCYMMIIATSTASWKRHVLADLRPYVCLWEDCTAPEMEFMRRHDWMLHEIQNHRKTYNCPCSCGKVFRTKSQCRDHVTREHPKAFHKNQLDTMIDLGTKVMEDGEEICCPLCKEGLQSMKEYQSHVGRHQEQLALFALPSRSTGNDAQVESNDSGTQSIASFKDLISIPGDTRQANQVHGSPTVEVQASDSAVDEHNETEHARLNSFFVEEGTAPHAKDEKLEQAHPLKSILKQHRADFSEVPNPNRKNVASNKDDEKTKGIPLVSKWTKISRHVVSPEALINGRERFKIKHDLIIVLRELTKEEVQAYILATAVLKDRANAGTSKTDSSPAYDPTETGGGGKAEPLFPYTLNEHSRTFGEEIRKVKASGHDSDGYESTDESTGELSDTEKRSRMGNFWLGTEDEIPGDLYG